MAKMVDKSCERCGADFQARAVDIKRGWGKFCSKSCKAQKQTQMTGIAGPHYKADGKTVDQMKNGQFAKSKLKGRRGYITNVHYEEWDDEVIEGKVIWSDKYRAWITLDEGDDYLIDQHPFSSEALGQWND